MRRLLFMLSGLCIVAGCSHFSIPFWPKPTPPPPMPNPETTDIRFQADQPLPTTRREVTALPTAATATPVAVGKLPLVYLVQSDGMIRVANVDAKADVVASAVRHNSTVAVDARRGVIVDGKVLQPGPLSGADRFEIIYSAAGSSDGAFISATETNNPALLRWRNPATAAAHGGVGGGSAFGTTQPTSRP